MTLTTERQQFEEWFTNKYPRSYWGVEKTASGEYQGGLAAPLWEAWQESRGFLANREAQPVALDVIARFKEWNTGFPVEKFKADYVIGWMLANYYAPPAPAVPPEATPEDIPQEHNINTYSGITWAAAWNACRAAMLKGERP